MKLLDFVAYAKKFCIALTAALTVLAAALSDGSVSASEWVQIASAALAAGGVFYAANTPKRSL